MLIAIQGNFVPDNFLPGELKGTQFYEPGKNPKEDEIRKRLAWNVERYI